MTLRDLAASLLALATPEHLRDSILGDLRERFERAERTSGPKVALRRYLRDVLTSLFPLANRRLSLAAREQWVFALVLGIIAFGVALATAHLVQKMLPAPFITYALMIALSIALCAVPRKPQAYAVAVLFLAAMLWSIVIAPSLASGRTPSYSIACVLNFGPLALVMFFAAAAAASLARHLRA